MKFNVQAFATLNMNQLIEEIDGLNDVSAVVLDNEFKIQYKKLSREYGFLGLKLKGKIHNNMSKKDFSVLENMSPSEIYHTFLHKNGVEIPAVAVRYQECLLVVMGDGYLCMKNIADEFESDLSGYDIKLSQNCNQEALDWIKINCDALSDILFRKTDGLKYINNLSAINIPRVISLLIKEMEDYAFGSRLKYSYSHTKELFVQGKEKDFALALVMLIAFCVRYDNLNEIFITTNEDGDDIVMSVSVDAHEINDDFIDFAAFRSKRVFEENGKGAFLIYSVKLISEYSLWDFDIDRDNQGFLTFKLKMPSVEIIDGFVIAEESEEYITELATAFFKDIT